MAAVEETRSGDGDGGGGRGRGGEGLELVEGGLEADPLGLVQREVEVSHGRYAVPGALKEKEGCVGGWRGSAAIDGGN